MRSAASSITMSRRPIRDFEYILRKLRKCLHIYVADTGRCGLGIFAAKPFKKNEAIIVDLDGDYYEQICSYAELEQLGVSLDITLQVGFDAYKLPTGSLEDFTNHSCDPNTGIKLVPKGTIVIALRDIATHEELTYDYSTYLNNTHEVMKCMCGSENCRGLIRNFYTLPDELKQRYISLGVVGDFAMAAPS